MNTRDKKVEQTYEKYKEVRKRVFGNEENRAIERQKSHKCFIDETLNRGRLNERRPEKVLC